jgi:hypothetical protein
MFRSDKASIALFAVLLLGGCGASGDSERNAAPDNPAELVQFLRMTSAFDYEPYPSPEAMRTAADIAILGRVDQVRAASVRMFPENTGGVVVALGVEEQWKADSTRRSSEFVYFLIHRPTNIGIGAYQRALPEGTRIALFGFHSTFDLAEGDPGDVVYDPAPQGLILEVAPDSAVNVWGHDIGTPQWSGIDTIDKLGAAMQVE